MQGSLLESCKSEYLASWLALGNLPQSEVEVWQSILELSMLWIT